MPPRRRAAGGSSTSKKKSRAKLAKELDLTPEEEKEIQTVFNLFVDEDELGPEVIATDDARKALKALGFSFEDGELDEIISAIDPEDTGGVSYETFLEACSLKIKDRDKQEEVSKAFYLFTGGSEGPITLAHLKRIARALNENVSDETLKDMLLEASTAERLKVNKEDFESVMKRAGAL